MKLSTIAFTAAMLLPISSAYAIPNMWLTGNGQGIDEYVINTPDKIIFGLSCTGNPDKNDIFQHQVRVELPNGKTSWSSETEITVVIDNSQYPIPGFLGWRNGDNSWLSFIEALTTADQFDVYIGDEKVATFTPGIKNTKKELGELSKCKEINYTN